MIGYMVFWSGDNKRPVETHVCDKDSGLYDLVDFARLRCPHEHLRQKKTDDLLMTLTCTSKSCHVNLNANESRGKDFFYSFLSVTFYLLWHVF